MEPICPSCSSEMISLTTLETTLEKRLSCWDCGENWSVPIVDKNYSRSYWKFLFRQK